MKRFLALMMVLVMALPMFGVSAAAAASQPTVEPLWSNTQSVAKGIYAVNGYGEAFADITGKTGVTFMEGTMTVYVKNESSWDFVTSNYCSAECSVLYLYAEFDSVKGAEYRADYSFTAYKGTSGETITGTMYGTGK